MKDKRWTWEIIRAMVKKEIVIHYLSGNIRATPGGRREGLLLEGSAWPAGLESDPSRLTRDRHALWSALFGGRHLHEQMRGDGGPNVRVKN